MFGIIYGFCDCVGKWYNIRRGKRGRGILYRGSFFWYNIRGVLFCRARYNIRGVHGMAWRCMACGILYGECMQGANACRGGIIYHACMAGRGE